MLFNGCESKKLDENNVPVVKFSYASVSSVDGSAKPPYKVTIDDDVWFLEQDKIRPYPSQADWDWAANRWKNHP